jgi:hypothetical protein
MAEVRYGGMTMYKNRAGKWIVRRDAPEAIWSGSSGVEALRAKLWNRRRRDADDIVPIIGNCGRSYSEPCGMKDPSQCAVHAQEPAPGGLEETKLHRLIVRARRARMNAPTVPPANETGAEQLAYVQRLRERHGLKRIDPRIIAADCAFRMRRF